MNKHNRLKTLSNTLNKSGLKEYAMKISSLIENKTNLFIVDFDGTIFKSPMAPPLYGSWWTKIDSLVPPCVPEVPTDDWWVQDVINQCKAAHADPNTYSILMTGRQEAIYGERVRQLLSQQGLLFDEVLLSDGFDSVKFKSEQISRILPEMPGIKNVKILDDRSSYLETYKSLINSINPEIEVSTQLINAESKASLCGNDNLDINVIELPKKAVYIGIFLDSESKARLLNRFPFLYDNMFADHVTVIFKPTSDNLKSMKEAGLLGKTFDLNVTGYSFDENCQAVTISAPGVSFPDGKIPHITISTKKGVKPVYSNELLANNGIEPVNDLQLKGIMWWSN